MTTWTSRSSRFTQRMTYPFGIDVVEVLRTQFAVLFFVFQQVIGADQQLMRKRQTFLPLGRLPALFQVVRTEPRPRSQVCR